MVKYSAALVLILLSVSAMAQSYDFSLPEFRCTVEVNRDRSLDIRYEILFQCTPGYSRIDIVDIGFPSDDFLLDGIEAGIDDHPLTAIYSSSYIDDGVEVHLDPYAIPSGQSGRFTFSGICRNMVFLDSEEDDYASVEFSPTWFDGGLLTGSSDFSLTILFPEGAEPALVRYHENPFTSSMLDKDGRVVYVWEETRRVDGPFTVGISFPASLVDGPLPERPGKPWISSAALVTLAVFGGFFLFFGLIIFAIVRAIIHANRRKEQYLPPKLGLEGTGIKRGLTAPVAALLLEEKLDRVLQLIIFGLLKKGNLQIDGQTLTKTGSAEGLHSYEKTLMTLIPDGTPDGFRLMFTEMIKDLDAKMKDFSLSETREYYRSIIRDAWKMVESDESAEKAGEILGDRLQWLLVDEKFDSRVEELPSGSSTVLPAYLYGMFVGRTASAGGAGGMSLSRACAELSGALETTAKSTVTGLSRLSAEVTATTNPVPVYTSSGHSSGSGCACACACAGCACACAGGGR
jgi:hypothetical protein